MSTRATNRVRSPTDEWDRQWQRRWSKVCLVKYSCAFIILPGGLGTLDEVFEAATLIQCQKIGPFPLILLGKRFWAGLRKWGQFMMKEGVFAKDEIGFGLCHGFTPGSCGPDRAQPAPGSEASPPTPAREGLRLVRRPLLRVGVQDLRVALRNKAKMS